MTSQEQNSAHSRVLPWVVGVSIIIIVALGIVVPRDNRLHPSVAYHLYLRDYAWEAIGLVWDGGEGIAPSEFSEELARRGFRSFYADLCPDVTAVIFNPAAEVWEALVAELTDVAENGVPDDTILIVLHRSADARYKPGEVLVLDMNYSPTWLGSETVLPEWAQTK